MNCGYGCFIVPVTAFLVFRSGQLKSSRAKQPKGCDAKLKGLPLYEDTEMTASCILESSGSFFVPEFLPRLSYGGEFGKLEMLTPAATGTDLGFASLHHGREYAV